MLFLPPMLILLLWLLWPGFHIGKPPLREVLLREPPSAGIAEGLYLRSLPSAIPGAIKGWPAVATARLRGDSVVVRGCFLEGPLEGADAALVEIQIPAGTFRADPASARILAPVRLEPVLDAVDSFLRARGSALRRIVLGYPVVASTDVPFLASEDCGQQWCPQAVFWDPERAEFLVRCHTRVLPNSVIRHRGRRDLGDRGIAWLRVDPQLARVVEVRLTRIEVYWLE